MAKSSILLKGESSMTADENDKQSRPENEAGDNSGTGGTNPSSPSGGKEEGTRIGTKTDIRGADAQKSGGETPAKDKLRDGT
jgi:uncharacterized protein with von Willebrand factor type A (vWA) domain